MRTYRAPFENDFFPFTVDTFFQKGTGVQKSKEVTIICLPCQKMGETVPSLNCVALITKISSKHKPGLLMISVEGLNTYTPELPHFLFEYVGKLASINGAS